MSIKKIKNKVNAPHENKYFECHIKVRRSLMMFIITEGCVTTGFTLSHSKDHMCCDAFNRTSESHGFSREYDKNTNVPR